MARNKNSSVSIPKAYSVSSNPIQSIPSPKAEPFKRWLAHVGSERIKEIENPELAKERMKEIYEQKGYSKSWIDKRL